MVPWVLCRHHYQLLQWQANHVKWKHFCLLSSKNHPALFLPHPSATKAQNMVVVAEQTARSVWRDRLRVTTKIGISFSERCKRSFVRTYFTTHLRMPTLEITLNLSQRCSSTRASTCSLREESWGVFISTFVRSITKSFCESSTHPEHLMQGNKRQQWQSTKSHLKNKQKQENRSSRRNLFQTLSTICCSSARERTLKARFTKGSQCSSQICMAKVSHRWFPATFNLTLFSGVGTYLTHVLIH